MNVLIKRFCVVTASVLMAGATALPASAASSWSSNGAQAVQVQYRGHNGRNHGRDRHGRNDFRMRSGHPYYHGHRGYDHYRHGYRRYNGYWFPPAAFIAGAIIGGAVASPPVSSGSAHVRWCEQQYRSYDPRTDTFQPYNGPRKRCVSPY